MEARFNTSLVLSPVISSVIFLNSLVFRLRCIAYASRIIALSEKQFFWSSFLSILLIVLSSTLVAKFVPLKEWLDWLLELLFLFTELHFSFFEPCYGNFSIYFVIGDLFYTLHKETYHYRAGCDEIWYNRLKGYFVRKVALVWSLYRFWSCSDVSFCSCFAQMKPSLRR